jgi:CheY-like chemotaxis protein
MLKISLADNGCAVTRLHLEGRVVGPWVEELKEACVRLLGQGRRPQLSLADVSFVDDDGLQLLSQLRRDGVLLVECSPFVAEQLKSVSHQAHG